LRSGNRASPEMRRVRFNFTDRIVLAPLELVSFGKYLLPVAAALYFTGLKSDAVLTAGALLAGAVAVPAFLPWLPGRAFAVKSAAAGGVVAAGVALALGLSLPGAAARVLIYSAAASFIGMNFTGASTYTSLSGVQKEMRAALPVQAACLLAGLTIMLLRRFL